MLIGGLLEKDESKRISEVMMIRKYSYICDLEFDWSSFLGEKMKPFYFPVKKSFNYRTFNNYEIFDASTVEDWN